MPPNTQTEQPQDGAEARIVGTVVEEVTRLLKPYQDTVRDVQTKLDGLESRGDEAPDSPKVKELEARLAEAEEQLRLATTDAQRLLPAGGEREREATFEGFFIRQDKGGVQKLRDLRRTNSEDWLQRAIDTGLFATGGKLSPEQASMFLDYVLNEQAALSRVQTRRMSAPQANIDKIGVNKRQIRKRAELTDQAIRNSVGTSQRQLTTVHLGWPEDISIEFLEDNIERRGAENHIVRMLATQFGNDLNDLAWNGDEGLPAAIVDANADQKDDTNGDTQADRDFRRVNTGWLALLLADAAVHDVDAAGAADPTAVLKAMRTALPNKFKSMTGLGYFFEPAFVEAYADQLADRVSGLGDQVIINGLPAVRYFGRPVIPDAALDGIGKGTYCDLQALVHGIQRIVTIEGEWKPRKQGMEYTITARNDYEYVEGDLIVLGDNIPNF